MGEAPKRHREQSSGRPGLTLRIDVLNRQGRVRVDRAALAAAARSAADWLVREGRMPPGDELAVVVVDNAAIRLLNQRFRNVNRVTDVMAFRLDPPCVGDLAVSAARAVSQARTAGHSVLDELRLLVVHGVLHLAGYRDSSPRERNRMWRIQTTILGRDLR